MSIQSRRGALEATQQTVKFFETLLRPSTDGIVITDTTQTIVVVNEAFCSFFGVRWRDIVETSLYIWLEQLGGDAPHRWADLEKRVRLEGACSDIEFKLTTKDGDKHLSINASLLERVADEERGVIISIWRETTKQKQSEEETKASLKEKEVLLQEIHHRVKNNMQVISSLLKLQASNSKDKKVEDALKESQGRVQAMSLVHETLYDTASMDSMDFRSYISRLSKTVFQSYGISGEQVELKIEAENISFRIDQFSHIGLIINELLSNSLKYAFPESRKGEIVIRLLPVDNGEVELIVSDNGLGIPENIDWRNTKTLGLNLIKMLTEDQLDGTLNLDRVNGTHFTIRFKLKESR